MYAWRNIEKRSRQHRCHEKAICITYCQCVSVALIIQHTMRMRRDILSCMACLVLLYFFQIISQTSRFSGKNVMEHKMRVLILYTNFLWTFLILWRIQRDITINVSRCSCKYPSIFEGFNETRSFLTDLRKIHQYQM